MGEDACGECGRDGEHAHPLIDMVMAEDPGEHGPVQNPYPDPVVGAIFERRIAARTAWEVAERLRHYEWCSTDHPSDQPCPSPSGRDTP